MTKPQVDNEIKQVVKGASVVFVGTLLGRMIQYVTKIVIARALGPTDFGIFNIGYAVIGIGITLALLGLPQGVARYIPYYREKRQLERVKGTLFFAIKIILPASLALSFIIFILSKWLSLTFFDEQRLIPFLRIFIWTFPFLALFQLITASLRGFKAVKYKVYSEDLFKSSSTLFALIIFLFLGFKLDGVAFSFLFASIGACVLGIYYLNRCFPILDRNIKSEAVGRVILAYSWPLILSSMLSRFQTQTDTLLLGYFTISSEVGIYGASLVVAQALGLILLGVNFIFMPVLTELYAFHRIEQLKRLYIVVTKWIFFMTFPVFLVLLAFAESILRLLFGPLYAEAAWSLRILAMGFAFNTFAGSIGLVTLAVGRTKTYLIYDLVGFVSNIGLNLLLIPKLGIMGAALATSLSMILWNITALMFVYKHLRLQPFRREHTVFSLASIAGFSILYLPIKVLSRNASWWLPPLLITAIYGILSLFMLVKFMGQDEEGRDIISALKRKFSITSTGG